MKNTFIYLIGVLIMIFSLQALASESQEKIYLVQMLNQLEALKPLIIAAEKSQPSNIRIQFHYQSYYDTTGKLHNGLFEDINEIEKGIKAKLTQTQSEPRRFQAIKGDYVNIKK